MARKKLSEKDQQAPYAHFYHRQSAKINASVLESIRNGDHRPADALAFDNKNDLLQPAYLPIENGHCRLRDGSFFVAVRTEMPNVTGEMIDWWFDWHPHDALRYRIWFPETHFGTRFQRDQECAAGDLPYWHTTHFPVEDIGLGVEEVIIRFVPPSEFGFDVDRFEESDIETIVCGYVGSVGRRMTEHTRMCHLVRRFEGGVEMRSRFWMGAEVKFHPFIGSSVLEYLVNNKIARRMLMPSKTGLCMAFHCAQEYSNLGEILPELFNSFGPR